MEKLNIKILSATDARALASSATVLQDAIRKITLAIEDNANKGLYTVDMTLTQAELHYEEKIIAYLQSVGYTAITDKDKLNVHW